MYRTDAIHWVVSICTSLRRSQAKTLSAIVAAGLGIARVSLAELGRCLSQARGVAAKHCIKRVDRFVGNPRIEPVEAMRGIVQWLARPRKRLLVSLDWVAIRSFECLVLAARLRGRAIPLLWSVHRDEDLYRSRNNLKYGLLGVLRTMVPASTQVVILADRGFGRAAMAKECQKLQFDYVIRFCPNVYVTHREFTGKLLDLPVRPGCRILLPDAWYRKTRPVRQHLAVYWDPAEEEPWFLMTSLTGLGALPLTKVFAKRMTIEAYFRDAKSKRNGLALRLTLVRSPERLGRLLLILAVIYLLLVMIGLGASKRYRPGRWCSNNRPNECSLFSIGRAMLHTRLPSVMMLATSLRREIWEGNWG